MRRLLVLSLPPLLLSSLLLVGCDDAVTQADPIDAAVTPAEICLPTGLLITPEQCDGRDNDCDGYVDENFSFADDPEHCGGCDVICEFGNAAALCNAGRCEMGACPEGTANVDGLGENGCEASCDGEISDEICDGRDNDCDGRTDEIFDLRVDLTNCGACGVECAFERGAALCDDRECILARCDAGFGDLNGDAADGCEAICEPENPGPERCDEQDNDCDGAVDEGFDLDSDGENCGACGIRCAFANGIGACEDAGCVLRACEEGFADADGRAENGCEAFCRVTEGGVEICDDVDNDCNGVIDDGIDKQTDVLNCGGCGTADERFICRLPNANVACVEGLCTVDTCAPGFTDADADVVNGCETACVPTGDEICDQIDNDCDGLTDEGFDLDADLQNCGGCGEICAVPDAEFGCVQGRCRLQGCPEGLVDADQNPLNGCEYACVPSMDPTEICDLTDNDCDGRVDEGFDTTVDLAHCGGCGVLCAPANALAICLDGRCDSAGCAEGWFDFNGDIEDGCEIECTPSEDGFEICDAADNDCDGEVDEDFDLMADPNHCGECGLVCSNPNGVAVCDAGECARGDCLPGWTDANGDPADGCEYGCVPTDDPTEICDGRDNDCDSRTDEGFDLSSLTHCGGCNIGCAAANATTVCEAGLCRIDACAPRFVDIDGDPTNGCEANCVPTGDEICDLADNDCDGRIDEGFDTLGDIAHCGGCNLGCALRHATPFCNGGECAVLSCDAGFADQDRAGANGCECQLSNGGVEICDGIDNDCNGVVDDADRLAPPADFGCLNRGVCRGVEPTCQAAAWSCPYPASYQAVEAACDHLDNDCDGLSDEGYPELGRPCADGIGACRVEGAIDCAGVAATTCTAVAVDVAQPEQCNDIDDDCDGQTDEDGQTLVAVPAGDGVGAFTIFAHEASRADATAEAGGESFTRACSKPGALPWVNVDYQTAGVACAAVGMRLCTAAEWSRACGAPDGTLYPYGDDYAANTCNGQDFDTDGAADGNQDTALPTGSLDQCTADWPAGPVLDLSGNVWEWTSADVSADGDGSARALRGGSFGNIAGGLSCDFSLATPPASFRQNIGFRCCRRD